MIKQSDNLIYGRNPVKEALRVNRVLKVYLSNSFADKTILDLIRDKHISVINVSNKELDATCPGVHQGCAAETKG